MYVVQVQLLMTLLKVSSSEHELNPSIIHDKRPPQGNRIASAHIYHAIHTLYIPYYTHSPVNIYHTVYTLPPIHFIYHTIHTLTPTIS